MYTIEESLYTIFKFVFLNNFFEIFVYSLESDLLMCIVKDDVLESCFKSLIPFLFF